MYSSKYIILLSSYISTRIDMTRILPTTHIFTLLFAFIFVSSASISQCPFPFIGFGAGTAPSPGNSVVIETCNFVGEHEVVNGVVAGDQYTVTYSGGAGVYLVIYDATQTPVFWGPSPLAFTAQSSGTFYAASFLDPFCSNFDPTFSCNSSLWSNVTPLPPPVNDLPCNAITLTPAATCSYATYTNDNATAAPGVPVPDCAGYLGGDVWFTTTVPASGIILIDTQIGVILDGGMAVYTGTCGSLTLVECDDDDSPNGAMPQIQVNSQPPGTQIWIRMWEVGNNNNETFGICVTEIASCGTPLTNDYCESPAQLTQGPGNFSSTTSAIYTADSPGNLTASFCGSIENNSWYQFTALSTTETFNFTSVTNCVNDPNNGAGVQAAVYQVFPDASGCCSALNLVSNCYSPGDFTLGTVTATPLTIGGQYILMVDGFSGDACDFTIANWVATGVLPVELSHFHGVSLTEYNALRWETSSELDNDYFNILRSFDGEDFESIGEVDGVGFSQEVNHYQFNDGDVRSGKVY